MDRGTASLLLPTCVKAQIPGNRQAQLIGRTNRTLVTKEVSLITEQEAILDYMGHKTKPPQIKELQITLTIGQAEVWLQG